MQALDRRRRLREPLPSEPRETEIVVVRGVPGERASLGRRRRRCAIAQVKGERERFDRVGHVLDRAGVVTVQEHVVPTTLLSQGNQPDVTRTRRTQGERVRQRRVHAKRLLEHESQRVDAARHHVVDREQTQGANIAPGVGRGEVQEHPERRRHLEPERGESLARPVGSRRLSRRTLFTAPRGRLSFLEKREKLVSKELVEQAHVG